jgi:hypothetical protein
MWFLGRVGLIQVLAAMPITRSLGRILTSIVGAFVLATLLLAFAVVWFLHDSPSCGNDSLVQLPSPDGLHKAVVFQRDCGATTDFSTQVSVLRASSSLGDASGNAFSSDTNHGAAPSGAGGGPETKVRWLSPTELAISHHKLARVFLAESRVDGVLITYEQLRE